MSMTTATATIRHSRGEHWAVVRVRDAAYSLSRCWEYQTALAYAREWCRERGYRLTAAHRKEDGQ